MNVYQALMLLALICVSGWFVGAEGVTNEAVNHINGLRLQQQLTRKEIATLFKPNGELTQAAVENSRLIPLKLNNSTLKQALAERSGNIEDWGKYETTPLHTSGGLARMHFYHNPVTNDVYYDMDFKLIFDHQGNWDLDLPRTFTPGPGY